MTPRRILIIKHGAFGDLLQAEGVLRDLRLFYKDARIVLLTQPGYRTLMERCPHIDAVLTDPRRPLWRLAQLWNLRGRLLAGDFDLVIDLQNSQRTRLYRKLLLPGVMWIQRPAGAQPVSGLQGQIDLLQRAGIDVKHASWPDLHWLADDMAAWLGECNIRPGFVLLLPGCSVKRLEKRWPFFSQLEKSLNTRGERVVTLLGPDEQDLAGDFSGRVLTGLNWYQLAGIIQQAGFVIGNDSGPSHLAAHLGKAGMAIFGPHSCARRAEIEREQFKPYSVDSLATLSVEVLVDYLQARGVITGRTHADGVLVSDSQGPANAQPHQRSHPVVQ